MKKIIKKLICTIIPIKKNRITIIDETQYSGSNSTALYEYILENNIDSKYEIKVFSSDRELPISLKIKNNYYKI